MQAERKLDRSWLLPRLEDSLRVRELPGSRCGGSETDPGRGTILLTGGMALVYLIDSIGILAYGMRILFGIGAGACFSGYFTFAADHIPEERRTEGLALFGVTGLIPLLVNPLSSQIVQETGDLQWFIPAVGAVVCASLLPLSQVREVGGDGSRKKFIWSEVWKSMGSRPLLPVWFIAFAFSGLVATFFSFSTVTAQDRGFENATSLWYLYAAGAAVIRISGARLLDRIGPSNLVAPALACYIASVLLCGSSVTMDGFRSQVPWREWVTEFVSRFSPVRWSVVPPVRTGEAL